MESDISPLPLDVVEHIQSFLNPKDAARSAAVCKQLHRSWSTTQNVVLDQRFFSRPPLFWDYASETMRRYIDRRLRIRRFHLVIRGGSQRNYLVRHMIIEAAILGAVEIEIELQNPRIMFEIPPDLFGYDDLQKIKIIGGTVSLGDASQVPSSNLQSLTLHPRYTLGDVAGFVSGYVMKCGSLQQLDCDCGLITFDFERIGKSFHSLHTLRLAGIRQRGEMYFKNLLRTFPRLKKLSLEGFCNCYNLRICSDTLECINIVDRHRKVVMSFNVPNLREFRFEGIALSSFYFEAHSPGWVCHIHVLCEFCNWCWLDSMCNFLPCFVTSNLHLTVRTEYEHACSVMYEIIDGEKVRVDILALRTPGDPLGLVESLLQICQPRVLFINGDLLI